MRAFSGTVVLLLALGLVPAFSGTAAAARPIEDYPSYVPSERCHPKPFAGTRLLGAWVSRKNGGGYVGMERACNRKDGPTSEHQTGRAFDWSVDADRLADRRRARDFLRTVFAADRFGNRDALARRMGIVYLIWDDQIYPAWNEYRPEPYLSSSCKKLRKCSKTLRHRDHVHVSLSRAGALGRTSWYERRI